jgi:hypothetical protein
MLASKAARAEWRRTSAIDWSTAYTLDEGALSVGVLSPLQVGVSDGLQVSVHPILLLVGKPSAALRYRLGPVETWTFALNVSATWSIIQRVDRDGREVNDTTTGPTGFPGTVQLTGSTTVQVGREWLFTVGTGAAADFLGGTPYRGLLEFHAAAHWLPSARHLVMLQLSTLLDPTSGDPLVRPSAQLLYAWAASARVQLGVGIAVGRFLWETGTEAAAEFNVFPILDAWFRF